MQKLEMMDFASKKLAPHLPAGTTPSAILQSIARQCDVPAMRNELERMAAVMSGEPNVRQITLEKWDAIDWCFKDIVDGEASLCEDVGNLESKHEPVEIVCDADALSKTEPSWRREARRQSNGITARWLRIRPPQAHPLTAQVRALLNPLRCPDCGEVEDVMSGETPKAEQPVKQMTVEEWDAWPDGTEIESNNGALEAYAQFDRADRNQWYQVEIVCDADALTKSEPPLSHVISKPQRILFARMRGYMLKRRRPVAHLLTTSIPARFKKAEPEITTHCKECGEDNMFADCQCTEQRGYQGQVIE